MNYQKIKYKQPPKEYVIAVELIKAKRFKEIVSLVNENSTLTTRDRYIYGYSLLQLQQNLTALVTLWPLAIKVGGKLKEDCSYIAAHIFNDLQFVASLEELSAQTIQTLLFIAKDLFPKTKIYAILQQKLVNVLWQKQDYAKLEQILKLAKQEGSGWLVENLSKLYFLQAESKLPGNIAGFVGYILTGATCLIIRQAIYHQDLAAEIYALADELKALFINIKSKQKLAWSAGLFNNFVDYEASIIVKLLPLIISNKTVDLDFIATPSYFIMHELASKQVGSKFLTWLELVAPELVKMYLVDYHNIVIWAFGGNNFKLKELLNLINNNNFNPYIKLALLLRLTCQVKGRLDPLVQISDFNNLAEDELSKNVAICSAKLIINSEEQINQDFWQILIAFNQVLQHAEFNNMLINRLINSLASDYNKQQQLNLAMVKHLAQLVNDVTFKQHINTLEQRQQQCLALLQQLNNSNQAAQIINNIKDQAALIQHFTLIADCFLLVADKLSAQFFEHIKFLVINKKINKISKLKDFFNLDLRECLYPGCVEAICRSGVPLVVAALNLQVACLPSINLYTHLPPAQALAFNGAILATTDPFKILAVAVSAAKPMIMQQVMQLIQQAPENMAIFRQAQSELFNPARRFLHHYLRYLSYEDYNNYENISCLSGDLPLTKIPFREEFLHEK